MRVSNSLLSFARYNNLVSHLIGRFNLTPKRLNHVRIIQISHAFLLSTAVTHIHSSNIIPKSMEVPSICLDHFDWMKNAGPCFPVESSKVKILHQPSEFFLELKNRARVAKRRVTIASLYLGMNDLEKELIDSFKEGLGNPNVKMKMLFEHSRGSRGVVNTRKMLLPLLEQHPDQLEVALYHSPHLRGIYKMVLPDKLNETVELSHLKAYLVDDTLILSGANLNDQYFTNRQDRYIVFEDCPKLADYFHQLISTVARFSLKMDCEDNLDLDPSWKIHPFLDNEQEFVAAANESLQPFLNYKVDEATESSDTLVFPLLQMKPLGISQDEQVTLQLMKSAAPGTRIKMASGYFNMTDEFIDTICNRSDASFNILTASPLVNGFYGASGLLGYIPEVYTCLEKRFYDIVSENNVSDRIELYEYKRPDWTYHAKGMWYYLPGQDLPCLTLIGSPNFGYRSINRDLECQVAIVTSDPSLQFELHKEQERLFQRSDIVTDATFMEENRKASLFVRLISFFFKNYF